ncbi:sushi, von Willebrand factor type A, EGF and pentraxin domain-containing protein 1-like isoform X2 [Haliotis asinina]|uniref:sushi, von Willebrand factor type A, EGF and pentraxin domain-containing protein 1-like isoform X2 n=1 Tax=Haliotis asinina TaxID=109174 RepID=UPI003531AF95
MRWSEYHVLLFSLALVTVVDGCGRGRRRKPRPPVNRSPSIACPYIGDVTAPASKTSVFVTWGSPSVSDDHGGWRVSQKTGRSPGSTFPEGPHTVVYQVVDRGGLTAVCARTFTVRVTRCIRHSRPRNGQMNCDRLDNIYGTTCTFSCDFGYYRDGMASSTCQSNGANQFRTPTCKKKSCGTPEMPPNSLSTICTDGSYYGSVCTLVCDTKNGYTPRYLNLATCLGTTVWRYHNWECPDTEKPKILNCPDGEIKTSNSSYVWTAIRATDNSGKVNLTQTAGQKPGSVLMEDVQIIVYEAVDPSGNTAPPCKFGLTYEEPSCAAPVSGGEDYDPVFSCPNTRLTVGTSCSASCRYSRVVGAKYIRCERSNNVIPASTWKGFDDAYPTCHKKACPDLNPPINGALICDKFFGGETCQIQCNFDYDVPEHMKSVKTLVCGSLGIWQPISETPDCTAVKFPDASKLPSELYYYIGDCFDNGTNFEIREAFLKSLTDAAVYDCNDGRCLIEDVDVTCGPVKDIDDGFGLDNDDEYYYYDEEYDNDGETDEYEVVDSVGEETNESSNQNGNLDLINRRRRDVDDVPSTTMVWTTEAPDMEEERRVQDGEKGSGAVRRRRKPIYQTSIKFNWVFRNTSSPQTQEEVTEFVDKALSTLRLSMEGKRQARFVERSRGNLTFDCGPGSVFANSSELLCVACPRGTFHDQDVDTCEGCPVHTYSDTSGQTTCTPCGQMKGTMNNGSKSDRDCIDMCQPGHFSATGLSPCTLCPLGTIQPEPYSTECIPCPSDSSTAAMGSSSYDECVAFDAMVNGPVELRLGPVIHDWSEDITLAFWLRTLPPGESKPNVSFVFSHPRRGHQMTLELSHQTNVIMRNRQVPVHAAVPQDLWTHVALVWKGYPSFVDIYRSGSRVTHYGDHTPLCFFPKDTELSILIGNGTGVTLRELYVLPLSNSSNLISRLSKSCSPEAVGFESLMRKVVSLDPSKISMVVPSVCSEINRCEPNPCNGHFCRSFKYGAECTCMGHYSGPTCETPPDYCVVANECQNDAQCQNIEGGVNCTCTDDFKGRYCEVAIVHGNWGGWSSWSFCSVTCNGGERSRSRKCDDPAPEPGLGKPCIGSSTEKSACSLNACPECRQSQLTVGSGASVSCDSGEDKGLMNCSVSCDQGLVFQEEPPSYTCTEALWVPGRKTISCVEFQVPDDVAFDYTVPYKTRVGRNMTDDLKVIRDKMADCATQTSCVQEETCQYVVTVETCIREAGGCSDIPEGYTGTIKFTVDVVASNWSVLISKNNLAEAGSTLNSTFNELEEIYEDCFLVRLTDGQVKPGTSVVDSDLSCPVGSVPDQGYCTTCAPGTIYSNGTCSQCERGWYQEGTGELQCDMCPAAYNTDYMGSSLRSECLAPPADAFMLLTDPITGHIWSVNMSDFILTPVALPDNVRLGSSGYDPITNHIFYADKYSPAIHSVGPTHSKTYIKLNWAATVDGLAIDPISRLIFYTDRGNDLIGVVTMATRHHKVVITENTHMPRHIEVDPVNGVIYWIDWGKDNKIERANYDGSDRRLLVKSAWPEGLSLDREAGRLYWGDAGSKTLNVMDVDGANMATLLVTYHHVSAITVFQDYLFYSVIKPNSSAMMRVNTDGSGRGETELPSFRFLSDIHAHRKSDYTRATNGCSENNGGCSFMCFPRPNGERVCACPEEHIMDENETGCKKKVSKSWWWDVWMQPRRQRSVRHILRPRHND